MTTNAQQIVSLIDRLTSKTVEGSLPWRAVGPNSFEVRLGDFSISLRSLGPRNSTLYGGTELTVTKLDGKQVATVSSMTNALASFSMGHESIPDQHRRKIDELFDMINNRSGELDEVLKLLK